MFPQFGEHRLREQLTGGVVAPSPQIVSGLVHARQNRVKDFDCFSHHLRADPVAADDRQLHQRRSPPQAGGAPTSSLRSASSSAPVISAAPPHRFALHRRWLRSSAPLLLIASLCIVVGSGHQRRSSSSLRSASSPAPVISAAPPHRFALHRRRLRSSAPLLLIASLCIVAGALHDRSTTSSLLAPTADAIADRTSPGTSWSSRSRIVAPGPSAFSLSWAAWIFTLAAPSKVPILPSAPGSST